MRHPKKYINKTGDNMHKEMRDLNGNEGVAILPGLSDLFPEDCVFDVRQEDCQDLIRNNEAEHTADENTSSEEGISNGKVAHEKTENIVQAYFQSLGDISLLTRDEETVLAKKIEEGTALVKRILSTMSLYPNLAEGSDGDGLGHTSPSREKRTDEDPVKMLDCIEDLVRQEGYESAALMMGLDVDEFKMKLEMIGRARDLVGEAKNEFIARNLRLVINVAKHHVGRGLPLLDLIQEGNIGLIKATDKFDYRKGFKFSTCATWWIRQAITKALLDQTKTIRVPANIMELHKEIARVSRELISELGREPDTGEIAQKLELPRRKVEETLSAVQDPLALQTPVGDGNTTLEDFIGDTANCSPYSDTENNSLTQQILKILHTLTQKESIVIRMRFGIGTDSTYTLGEIGKYLSITCERVRQIEARAMNKLKQPRRIKELEGLVAT